MEQSVSLINTYKYGFSILDATDKTCETYTKVSLAQIEGRFQPGTVISRSVVVPGEKRKKSILAPKLTVRR